MFLGGKNKGRREGEGAPLLDPSNASRDSSSKYYFLNKDEPGAEIVDPDSGEELEATPTGATDAEFAPRVLKVWKIEENDSCRQYPIGFQ